MTNSQLVSSSAPAEAEFACCPNRSSAYLAGSFASGSALYASARRISGTSMKDNFTERIHESRSRSPQTISHGSQK